MNDAAMTQDRMRETANTSLTPYIIRWILGLTLLYLSWKVVAPFIPALTLALAFAIVMHPLQRNLENRFGSEAIATVCVIFVVIVGIMLPGIVLLSRIGHEVISGIGFIHGAANSGEIERILKAHPTLAQLFRIWNARVDLESALGQFGASIAAFVSRAFSNSVWVVMQISVAVFAMFFFLRDRALFYALLVDLTPTPRKNLEQLCVRIAQTIRAAIFGNIAVKLIQGALGGLMFWALGLPAPLFWGATMAVTALVPIVGTSLVWAPAAVFLIGQGHWIRAVVLIIWGSAVVSTIDNVIYPLIVGRELRLHTLAVFIAFAGGLAAFGASGVILGPMILATIDTAIDSLRRHESFYDSPTP
jgi:predicted PurR-regulated permease PerM